MLMTDEPKDTALRGLNLDKDILAEIAKNTSNAVIVTGLDGKIIYVNEGFERITEYPAEEVVGKKPGKILQGPETSPEVIKRIRKGLLAFGRVNETIINYSKTGRKYWLQLDIYPLFDEAGIPQCFMAIESDVTQMKENERLAIEQNQRIQENISYAQLLQDALFRDQNTLPKYFKDSFVIDRPKDSVGGDFYLVDEVQGKKIVLVGDCTGHGVSGAIMTAMSISIIREQLAIFKTLSAGLILTKSLHKLGVMLSESGSNLMDTFEATLLIVDDNKRTIRYASTNQSLYLVSNDMTKVIKGNKTGFGKELNPETLEGKLPYEPDAMIYLSSDGFQDQFGGPDDKKFSSAGIKNLLSEIYDKDCAEQSNQLVSALEKWKAGEEQTDDILMIGIRLGK